MTPPISSPDLRYQAPKTQYQAPTNSTISRSYLTLFALHTISKSHEHFDDQQNKNEFLILKQLCFILSQQVRYEAFQGGVLMSPCRSFSSPPVAYLARDKCRCRVFARIQMFPKRAQFLRPVMLFNLYR